MPPTHGSVRIAAIQATPVPLNLDATITKTVALIGEAASLGASLLVFPECFVSVYPSGAWAADAAKFDGADRLWELMWESSVDIAGAALDLVVDACRQHNVFVVLGVNEREDTRPGTLYNTMLLLGSSGVLMRHRKTMPTMHERVFHGMGTGADIEVLDVPGVGRVGGLICWENRMPLARWAVYQGGPQIWVAPTADDSDSWQATMRHIAIEAGTFTVGVAQYLPREAFGSDFPAHIPDDLTCLGRGGSVIVDPFGTVIAGPLMDEEGIVLADCDLRQTLHAKRWFDVVGHYSRPELFAPGLSPAPRADLPTAAEFT